VLGGGIGMMCAVMQFFPEASRRPSVYFWRVSLGDDTGLLDVWDCIPELAVATQPVTHPSDEWAGILNMPCKFNIQKIN